MKLRTFIIYIAYVWTKIVLGLTVNPYKFVKETINRPILLPVIVSPILGLLILLVASGISSRIIFVYGTQREMLGLILSTVLIAIILWQLLIFYLLGNFLYAKIRNK